MKIALHKALLSSTYQLSRKWQTELRSLQKQNFGLFLLCSKERGVFSNERAAVEDTWKTADKREKDADV